MGFRKQAVRYGGQYRSEAVEIHETVTIVECPQRSKCIAGVVITR